MIEDLLEGFLIKAFFFACIHEIFLKYANNFLRLAFFNAFDNSYFNFLEIRRQMLEITLY